MCVYILYGNVNYQRVLTQWEIVENLVNGPYKIDDVISNI